MSLAVPVEEVFRNNLEHGNDNGLLRICFTLQAKTICTAMLLRAPYGVACVCDPWPAQQSPRTSICCMCNPLQASTEAKRAMRPSFLYANRKPRGICLQSFCARQPMRILISPVRGGAYGSSYHLPSIDILDLHTRKSPARVAPPGSSGAARFAMREEIKALS